MSSKKKLIITISSLCVIVMVAVLTVTLVLAFGSGALKTNVNVSYKADSAIKGTITAEYKLGDGGTYTSWHDVVTFTGQETGSALNQEKTGASISLTRENPYVIFKYSFTVDKTFDATKNGYTGALRFTAGDGGNTNVNIETSTDGDTYAKEDLATTATSVTVASDTATVLYVKVSVANILNDASFNGSFDWTLTPISA